MKNCLSLSLGALAVATVFAAPARAADIVLYDTSNSFATAPHGAEALLAFRKAANYWNKTLSTNATVNIDIGFSDLGSGILGSTGSSSSVVAVRDVYGALAHSGNSTLDALAVAALPRLNASGSLAMRVNAYLDPVNQVGIDPDAASRLSNGNNGINQYLDVNTSVQKALGLAGSGGPQYDARITFSSAFAFDFNPSNGIGNGQYDFTAVAVHELGHALGFVSGADSFDVLGGKGPYAAAFNSGAFGSSNIDDFAVGSTLDLFRYGNGFNPDGSRQLQWGANKDVFFSIDGQHVFNLDNPAQEAAAFATGAYNGDGHQASHWADNRAWLDQGGVCFQSTRQIGIMDPTIAACAGGSVTQNDLAAFDAMGWNLNTDVLSHPGYAASSKDIYELAGLATVVAVPEPASYAMLLAGLGLCGAISRRRAGTPA